MENIDKVFFEKVIKIKIKYSRRLLKKKITKVSKV